MIKSFFSRTLGSSKSNQIIVSGNGSIAIQGSNVVINGKSYESKNSIAVVNDEVYIDGFHQGDVSPLDYLTHGLLK